MEHVIGAPSGSAARDLPAAERSAAFAILLPVIAPAALVAAVLALAGSAAVVSDTWLALVSGREIWEHGLPHSDRLTVLHLGQPWVDQQWLGHLALYGADRLGGLGLVVAVSFAAVLCGFCLAGLAALERGAPPLALSIFFFISFLSGIWIADARTQALAVPLYGLVLWLSCRDPDCSRRLTLLMLPTLCLWANIHGSVLLGAAVVGAYGLVAAVRSRSRQGALVAAAAPLCVLASPYATALPGYYRLMLAHPPFQRWITEWQRTVPSKMTAIFFVLAAVVAAMLVIRRRGGADALILLIAFVAALSAVRMLPWFGIAALALAPQLFSRSGSQSLAGPGGRTLSIAMTAAIAACIVVAGVRGNGGTSQVADLGRIPLSAHDLVYPDFDLADRLLWARPELRGRVAYDARVELLSAKALRKVLTVNARAAGWRSAVGRFSVLALDPESRTAGLGGWRVMYRSSNVVLARRIGGMP
jgi:hypothetical protein